MLSPQNRDDGRHVSHGFSNEPPNTRSPHSLLRASSLFPFVFGLFGHHLQHSRVWLSFGPWLSRLYICPAQHQIHYSRDPRYRDKNSGVKFAVWDALFGTLYVPKEPETLQVGLSDADPRDFTTISKLYFLPFARIARSLIALPGGEDGADAISATRCAWFEASSAMCSSEANRSHDAMRS